MIRSDSKQISALLTFDEWCYDRAVDLTLAIHRFKRAILAWFNVEYRLYCGLCGATLPMRRESLRAHRETCKPEDYVTVIWR